MSKQLLLLRHAKSSWDDPSAADRERGLNNRGRRNAPQMGRALSQMLGATVVHVSPARRAQLTLGGLQDGWSALQGLNHVTVEALYTFSAEDLVSWISSGEHGGDSLFIIGHNPALTDLTNWLVGEAVLPNLPTCGFVHLSLDLDSWADISAGCGRIESSLFPKELKGTA